MAIERPGAGAMMEAGMEETMPPEAMDESVEELVVIPPSQLGGATVSPGDVVRLEVVSVDEESGTVSARYAQPSEEAEEPEEPKALGVEALAAEFD